MKTLTAFDDRYKRVDSIKIQAASAAVNGRSGEEDEIHHHFSGPLLLERNV